MEQPIQLSVVATSRNDNHGKNLLYRMQHFVEGFIAQCKRHNLRAELILVDWNPPEGKQGLEEVLSYPKDKDPCIVRVIRVPREVHAQLDHADKIPLFQMIAKNVGIRRAKGQFILATNIDVLFSDPLMKFLKHHLKPQILYRADRLDIPEQLPETNDFEEILRFCSHNYFRINSKFGTINYKKRKYLNLIKNRNTSTFNFLYKGTKFLIQKTVSLFVRAIRKIFFISLYDIGALLFRMLRIAIKTSVCFFHPKNNLFLHTNACGDFTLLSKEDWAKLKGYPEWNIFSWHIDSVLLHQARQHGIKKHDLPRKMSVYHIEHEIGSGYSAEGAQALFKRLEAKGIPYLSNANLKQIISELHTAKQKMTYNSDDWGFGNLSLKEFVI